MFCRRATVAGLGVAGGGVLGAVYLSQHRFAEAVEVAKRAIAVNDRDA
jgi:hypothetical protein